MSTTWTESEYRQYMAKRGLDQMTCAHEALLHGDILAECQRRGWIVFHGSMAHRTFRTPGEPDFVILCDGGKTLLVEAKTRQGKLSRDQLAIKAWAAKLGHTVHVVRSLQEFVEML